MSGKVYLVGAGCGDFDLITLRGLNLLKRAEVIVYDSLIDNRLLDFASENAELVSVGKRFGRHSETQENINNILVQKAKKNNIVVRLKGGDPFVFGRGGEEGETLARNNIDFEIIPGISSCIAVPELAGIPVTHRGVSRGFHVITGHTSENLLPENMKEYARLNGTLVFLMGLNKLSEICESLILNGKDASTPAAVISNGASRNQKVVRGTLENISKKALAQNLKSPAVIVIGEVAKYHFASDYAQTSVTVTGTKKFTEKLCSALAAVGVKAEKLDYLDVVELKDNREFSNALKKLSDYSWLVFTSTSGVDIFFRSFNRDIRKLANFKFAVVGSGTAKALAGYGIRADLIPRKYTAKALGEALAETVKSDEKILILRSARGSAELTKKLKSYDDIKIYDLRERELEKAEIKTDYIVFASPSGVNLFFESGCTVSPKTKVIAIGEITAGTLKKYKLGCKIANVSGSNAIIEIIKEAECEKIQTASFERSNPHART